MHAGRQDMDCPHESICHAGYSRLKYVPWTGVLDCLNAELLRRLPQMPYIAIVNIVCWCVGPHILAAFCRSRPFCLTLVWSRPTVTRVFQC